MCIVMKEWIEKKHINIADVAVLHKLWFNLTYSLVILQTDEFPPQVLETPGGLFELCISGREEALSHQYTDSAWVCFLFCLWPREYP